MDIKISFLTVQENSPANFWCPSKLTNQDCIYCSKHGSLTLLYEPDLACPNTNEDLKFVGVPVLNGIVGKLPVAKIQQERQRRSKLDFNKNILPSFKKTSDEAIYFEKRDRLGTK